MNNFETIIGIEVHAALNTKYKIFSNSINSHISKINTNINPIDLGLPGTLPILNPEVIEKAVWLAYELNATTNYNNICFDRKNYFYQDLPKGYQITQQYYPFATNGYIMLDSGKKINIERFHLEEDTAKQFNEDNKIILDYNRCGTPLIEIVTKPDITSSNEAIEYLQKLIRILKFTNISDAKLEEGSLRADINISIRPYGSNILNTKVEIKNLNSLSNIAKAIDYEIQRQIRLYLENKPVLQETRRFDESSSSTITMRLKSDAIDYRYIFEPNLLHYKLSDEQYNLILSKKNKSINIIYDELLALNIDINFVNIMLDNYEIYHFFNQLNLEINRPELIINWIINELLGYINKAKININDFINNKYNDFKHLLLKIISEDLNGKQAKLVCSELVNTDKNIDQIIKENNLFQIKDPEIISNYLKSFIQNNMKMLDEYNTRPERVEKFFIGLLMKETNGQANPNVSMSILKELLKNGL